MLWGITSQDNQYNRVQISRVLKISDGNMETPLHAANQGYSAIHIFSQENVSIIAAPMFMRCENKIVPKQIDVKRIATCVQRLVLLHVLARHVH
jgi:hypothetical protein